MTVPLLVLAGQAADGLAYQLAYGHGTELNWLMAPQDPVALLVLKIACGAVVAFGVYALRRPRLGAWLAAAGFVGAFTEILAT